MISVRSLVASSGPFRLRPVDLEIESGELLALLGPSGAGKTVLLEALLGLRDVHEGTIVIDGRTVTETPPEERRVAYMPQDVALFPHLTVRENIEFGRRVRGQRTGLDDDVSRVAGTLGITPLLERKGIRSLSGGEAQRVALARALVTQPRVLFLDESFSALDSHIRRRLLLQFRALQQEMKLTAIYVTHSLGEAAMVADRVAVLVDGSIVQVSRPDQLFREPRDLRVARFLQLDNLYPVASAEGRRCRVAGIDLDVTTPLPEGGPLWIAVATGDVMIIADDAPVPTAEGNRYRGTIVALDRRHNHSRARIAIDGSDGLEIECDVSARDRLVLGTDLAADTRVGVHVPADAIAVFPEVIP